MNLWNYNHCMVNWGNSNPTLGCWNRSFSIWYAITWWHLPKVLPWFGAKISTDQVDPNPSRAERLFC